MIENVQCRERGVIADPFAGAQQSVVLIRRNVLEAHPWRNRPVADIHTIVDIPGVRFGAGAGIAIVRAGGAGQLAAGGRGVVTHFVGRFVDVAIADADFVGGWADHKALAVARFDAADPVFARGEGNALALFQVAAAQGVRIEPLNIKLMLRIRLKLVAEAGELTTPPEAVVRSGRLPAVGVIVGAREAAGHIGFAVVVLQQAVKSMHFVGRVFAFQHHIINPRRAAFAPVAAAGARIEQSGAETVFRRAADREVMRLFRVVLRRGGAELSFNAALNAKILGDCAGDEVHRAAAAHDIDGVHIAERDRRQRKLRLAVGGEGNRNTVHQHRGTAGKARIEAANTKVHRQIVTAGTGIFRRVNAGDPVQHFAHRGGAGFAEIPPTDNVAGAGVFKDIVFARVAEPVPDDGEGGF